MVSLCGVFMWCFHVCSLCVCVCVCVDTPVLDISFPHTLFFLLLFSDLFFSSLFFSFAPAVCLRPQVVLAIRSNHELEHNLNQMDIKIGLLVKNRIELEDVVNQNRELKKARKRGSSQKLVLPHQQGGLKSLTKQSRQKLESYQHLFYLLQTKPQILARLVFLDQPMPGWSNNKTGRFLEDAIQLIYNYASNAREQYLLLKLYRTALKTEIQEKVNTVKEIITGNPTAIKLVINQYRSSQQGVYVCMRVHACVCACVCACVRVCACVCMRARVRVCMHVHSVSRLCFCL